ncbi:FecR domain-containing protein [Paenalcaligenes hominis]|uniref:FecR domain-containing protein n=1 Tax=Paenalcaligenes hominis TaxID=643674 RepID=UPI00352340BB
MFESLLSGSRVQQAMATKRWAWLHWVLVLAGAGFIALLGFYSYQSTQPYFHTFYTTPHTAAGYHLPDGTTVQLHQHGVMQVRLFERRRTAELVSGTAQVVVQPHAGHSFQLRMGPVHIHTQGAHVIAKHNPSHNRIDVQLVAGAAQLVVGRWWPKQYQLQAGQRFMWPLPE